VASVCFENSYPTPTSTSFGPHSAGVRSRSRNLDLHYSFGHQIEPRTSFLLITSETPFYILMSDVPVDRRLYSLNRPKMHFPPPFSPSLSSHLIPNHRDREVNLKLLQETLPSHGSSLPTGAVSESTSSGSSVLSSTDTLSLRSYMHSIELSHGQLLPFGNDVRHDHWSNLRDKRTEHRTRASEGNARSC
jgi:hypothetical protein